MKKIFISLVSLLVFTIYSLFLSIIFIVDDNILTLWGVLTLLLTSDTPIYSTGEFSSSAFTNPADIETFLIP